MLKIAIHILLIIVLLFELNLIQNFKQPSRIEANKAMGISITLYRVNKAEKVEDLKNLEKQIENSKDKKIDLYKITEDLAIIFLNNIDPYSDTSKIEYKMLFGHLVDVTAGIKTINGFIPSNEIEIIADYIVKKNIETFEGFTKIYDNISAEAKQLLEDIGSPDKKELFTKYVQPLTKFYFCALKNNNSVVIIGE